MSAFSQNSCLSGFDFGDSLVQGDELLWCSKIRVFLGWILAILWPKVMNNYGVPEIHVFLYSENAQILWCG